MLPCPVSIRLTGPWKRKSDIQIEQGFSRKSSDGCEKSLDPNKVRIPQDSFDSILQNHQKAD